MNKMTNRFINPRPQFLDDAGKPVPSGKLFFYENNTATPKTVYADVNETIPAPSNGDGSIPLSAAGKVPNIFYSGTARVVFTDASDVQIWDINGVGFLGSGAAFDDWSSVVEYEQGAYVVASDGSIYRGLANSNLGNDPLISPASWERVEYVRTWNTNVTYNSDDIAKASDGYIYRSVTNGNQGNDPAGGLDSTNWGSPVFGVSGQQVDTDSDVQFRSLLLSMPDGNTDNIIVQDTPFTEDIQKVLGGIEAKSNNSIGTNKTFGKAYLFTSDMTDGTEYCQFRLDLIAGGAYDTNMFSVNSLGLVTSNGGQQAGFKATRTVNQNTPMLDLLSTDTAADRDVVQVLSNNGATNLMTLWADGDAEFGGSVQLGTNASSYLQAKDSGGTFRGVIRATATDNIEFKWGVGDFEFHPGGTHVATIDNTGGLLVDNIGELTAAAGVTVDGVLLKDGSPYRTIDSLDLLVAPIQSVIQTEFTDADTLITPGFYHCRTWANAANNSTAQWSTIEVFGHVSGIGSRLTQVQRSAGNTVTESANYEWIRHSNDNGVIWGDWRQFSLRDADGTLSVDVIGEETSAAGVTVDGVLMKDNDVRILNNNTLSFRDFADTSWLQAASLDTGDVLNLGVGASAMRLYSDGEIQMVIDNNIIRPAITNDVNLGSASFAWKDGYFDGTLYTDTINELTPTAGVTVDGVLLKDGEGYFTNGDRRIYTEITPGGTAEIRASNPSASNNIRALGLTGDIVQIFTGPNTSPTGSEIARFTPTSFNTDTISELTASAGVTFNSDVIISATGTASLELVGGAAGDAQIDLLESGKTGLRLRYDGTANQLDFDHMAAGVKAATRMSLTRDTGVLSVDTISELTSTAGVTVSSDLKVDGFINLGGEPILTISAGAVTATKSRHIIAAETGTADDLATINGGSDGDLLILQADTGDTITFKDGTGNILLAGDFVASGLSSTLTLVFAGTNWLEISRSAN
jgi:hypothetical protein